MAYTIKKTAELSGVSTRTLRYYDEISLLKPAQINSSGYRLYGEKEINRLQQILYYRELNLNLEDIKSILDDVDFDVEQVLEQHYQKLLAKKERLEGLLDNLEKTMKYYKGEVEMTDTEKFMAFKEKKVLENEQKYGDEMCHQYGEDEVKQTNKKYLRLTEADFEEMKATERTLFNHLKNYIEQPMIESEVAKEIFMLHKNWLSFTLPNYSTEMHKNIGTMYVEDSRFKSYYDLHNKGTAQALHDIIQYYAN